MFNKMKIRVKLLISFIAVAIIACIIGFIGYNGMQTIQKGQDQIATVILPSIQSLLEISECQTNVKTQEMGLLVRRFEGEDRKHFYTKLDGIFKDIATYRGVYDPLPQTEDEAAAWKEFLPAWDEWVKDHEEYIAICKQKDDLISQGATNENEEVKAIDSKSLDMYVKILRPAFSKAEKSLLKVVDINKKNASLADTASDEASSSAVLLLIIWISIGIVLAIIGVAMRLLR